MIVTYNKEQVGDVLMLTLKRERVMRRHQRFI